jgi:hypothetical protein
VYDKAGKRVSRTFDNGTAASCRYDDAGRLLSSVNTNTTAASLIARFDYTLDVMGNRIQKQVAQASLNTIVQTCFNPSPFVVIGSRHDTWHYHVSWIEGAARA